MVCGSTLNEFIKNPHGCKKIQNPGKKSQTQKCPCAEAYSNNDLDQTLFLKFIALESTEDTLITKLSPFIIEKTLTSMIKPKPLNKLANTSGRSQGRPEMFFSIFILRCRIRHHLIPLIAPLTFDPCFIMLSVKQGGMKFIGMT